MIGGKIRLVLVIAPTPIISKPKRRKNNQRCFYRISIGNRNTYQDIIVMNFGVFYENIKIFGEYIEKIESTAFDNNVDFFITLKKDTDFSENSYC